MSWSRNVKDATLWAKIINKLIKYNNKYITTIG